MYPLFSVGHSSMAWSDFLKLLQQHKIGVIADVRSRPRSRWPHFSRPALRTALNAAGISYLWMGDDLGGLSSSGEAHDYEQAVARPAFQRALEQCQDMADHSRVALMCSEGEPCECHRFLLLARYLDDQLFPVRHIRRDGSLERQCETEDRLLAMTRQTDADLLASREQRLAMAYRAQALRLARKAR